MMKKTFTLFCSVLFSLVVFAQGEYRYAVDLTKLTTDTLHVELMVPVLKKGPIVFNFPKIIPGTYSVSDYGKYIHHLKAFDKAGKSIAVNRQNDNQWMINNTGKLHKITYQVEDIFDTEQKNTIYPMAATNFEADKNIVLNTPGLFGFFDGYAQVPFTINFTRPAKFYASTSLKPASVTGNTDVFRLPNVDELYDSPIMYGVPDTTTLRVGNTDVLVSVYSPAKGITSANIAGWLSDLLHATKDYLGGKLPAEKYAFLFYFKDPRLKHSFPPGVGGALEHNTSSFYYLSDAPAAQLKNSIVNISSHEFFHIITPLNIASKEIREFNYSVPVLSKHLWLYEGTTEYTAHHVQVKQELSGVAEFLNKLSGKITVSRTQYNDTLPFTAMSKEAADKYEKEYGNVYQKGALIGATLDIYLLHLSNGNYGLRNLTHDLGILYGKNKAFNDEELFDKIAELTYPEVKTFLQTYVAGSAAIPYEYYFGLAGVNFIPKSEKKVFSFGGFLPALNKKGNIYMAPQSKFNDFGKKLGYKAGDELYTINNVRLTPQTFMKITDSIKNMMKEGDVLTVKIGRENSEGIIDTMLVSAAIFKVTDVELNKLQPMPNTSPQQKMVFHAWLMPANTPIATEVPEANDSDVTSVDAITKALYDVISGPAGPRNWQRFNSLFLPEAKMGAVSKTPAGGSNYVSFTPAQYIKMNTPGFMQMGFFEEELGRNTSQFGNIASVQSAYQYRFEPHGKVMQRGINHINLVNSKGRWWIASINWQDENDANPIPAAMLKK